MFGLEYRKQTNIVDFLSKLQIPIAMGHSDILTFDYLFQLKVTICYLCSNNFISINFDLIKKYLILLNDVLIKNVFRRINSNSESR
jgi:hypothetical protein